MKRVSIALTLVAALSVLLVACGDPTATTTTGGAAGTVSSGTATSGTGTTSATSAGTASGTSSSATTSSSMTTTPSASGTIGVGTTSGAGTTSGSATTSGSSTTSTVGATAGAGTTSGTTPTSGAGMTSGSATTSAAGGTTSTVGATAGAGMTSGAATTAGSTGLTQADTGLPSYTGATTIKTGTTFEQTLVMPLVQQLLGTSMNNVKYSIFDTSDSPDKVLAFYDTAMTKLGLTKAAGMTGTPTSGSGSSTMMTVTPAITALPGLSNLSSLVKMAAYQKSGSSNTGAGLVVLGPMDQTTITALSTVDSSLSTNVKSGDSLVILASNLTSTNS